MLEIEAHPQKVISGRDMLQKDTINAVEYSK